MRDTGKTTDNDETLRIKQEETAAFRDSSVSDAQESGASPDPMKNESGEEEEIEIPEESKPNITELFESIQDKDDKDPKGKKDDDKEEEGEGENEDELEHLIDEGSAGDVDEYYEDMQPVDFVEEVEELDDADIVKLSHILDTEQLTEIMEEADDELRQRLVGSLPDERLLEIFEGMSKDDIVDILGDMATGRRKGLLNKMRAGDRRIIHTLLQFPDESAGGIMTTEYIALKEDRSCAEALDIIRDIGPKTEVIETIYITDNERRLVGTVDLRDLLSASRNTKLQEIMEEQVISVEPELDQEEVAKLVSRYDLQAIPVVSRKNTILGIITVDDIIDVINEEHDEDIAHLGGTSKEEDLDTSLFESIRMRLPWLLINLITAFIASMAVKVFESTIAQVVALSATMTIVSGMGGNAGTQTMSILVRELSKEDVNLKGHWRALVKEVLEGIINGAVCGLATGIVVSLVYRNFYLGIIILLAEIGNLVSAGFFGFLIPVILKKLHADPALASSIFLTTVTDTGGFFIYLGIATLFLSKLL